MYKEFSVDSRFRKYIDALWSVTNSGKTSASSVVTPDGFSDIIIKYDHISDENDISICGEMTRHLSVEVMPGEIYTGIRFKPGALFSLLNIPMDQLADRLTPVSYAKKTIYEHISNSTDNKFEVKERLAGLNSALSNILYSAKEPSPITEYVAKMIVSSNGNIKISKLSDYLGYSPRHLQRVFKQSVGVSPKMYSRIIRFKSLHNVIKSEKVTDLYAAALSAGYFDQSHFIKEYLAFSGKSPAQMSHFYNTR